MLLYAISRKIVIKSSKFEQYFSADPTDLSRDGDSYVGKVRSNLVGTKFTIFGAGTNPIKPPKPEADIIYREVRFIS